MLALKQDLLVCFGATVTFCGIFVQNTITAEQILFQVTLKRFWMENLAR